MMISCVLVPAVMSTASATGHVSDPTASATGHARGNPSPSLVTPYDVRDPRKVVRPQDFGAVGDGKHNDTDALLRSVAACSSSSAGGSCDLVIANGTFLTGPMDFTGVAPQTRLVLDGTGTLLAIARTEWLAAGWTAEALVTGNDLIGFSVR